MGRIELIVGIGRDDLIHPDVLHIHTVALFFPPFESDLTAGTTLLVIPKPSAIWGVAICKDMGGLTREDRVPRPG
jgi:hypothetical protein